MKKEGFKMVSRVKDSNAEAIVELLDKVRPLTTPIALQKMTHHRLWTQKKTILIFKRKGTSPYYVNCVVITASFQSPVLLRRTW
jgi:D-ribose pyranose/furanose isomerase RbsD